MNDASTTKVGRLPGVDALVADFRADPRPVPRSCVDANGQFLPETPEQAGERTEAILRMLDEIETITDETDDPEILDAVDRDIDAGRPHRPLFGAGA